MLGRLKNTETRICLWMEEKKMELHLSGNVDTNIAIKNSRSLMSSILMPRDEEKTTTNNWQILKRFF